MQGQPSHGSGVAVSSERLWSRILACANIMHIDPKLFAILCLVVLVGVYLYTARPENFREHIWAWVLAMLITAVLLAIAVYAGWLGGIP